jgi:hypothetical protein
MSGLGDVPVVDEEPELDATGLAACNCTAGRNDDDGATSVLLVGSQGLAPLSE